MNRRTVSTYALAACLLSYPCFLNAAPEGSTSTVAISASADAKAPQTETERKKALVEEYERTFHKNHGKITDEAEPRSFGSALLHMALVLGGICLLIYVLLGKFWPWMLKVRLPSSNSQIISVVERLTLDPKKSILVLKAAEEYLLVGATEQGLSVLSKLKATSVEENLAAKAPSTPGKKIKEFLPKPPPKES